MNNENNYIATVMTRYIVGEDAFIFCCSHIIQGEVDEETHFFIDSYGNEYANMLDPNILETEFNVAYYNLIEAKDLDSVIEGEGSKQEKLSEYEYLSRRLIYYVGKLSSGIPFCIPLKIDELKEKTEASMRKNRNLTQLLSNPVIENEEQINSDDSSKEYEEELDSALVNLISDIVAKKFDLEELKALRANLLLNIEDLENILDTVELEISSQTSSENQEIRTQTENGINLENDIDIEDLYNKITKTLIGQDMAVRRILVEISRKLESSIKKKDGILLTGPTGVGKSKLISLIAKYLGKPFYKVNTSSLTCAGWSGIDIEEVLWDLYI